MPELPKNIASRVVRQAAESISASELLLEFYQALSPLTSPIAIDLPRPQVSAAALRAGFIEDRRLLIDLSKANLRNLYLQERDLSRSVFTKADLVFANLSHCDLRYCDFSGAQLTKAVLIQVDARFANFANANLKGAHFVQSHLGGANFSNALLKGVRLFATYDKTTIWPKGFDADEAGGVLVEES